MLTDKHIELLYKMCDVHFKCFQKFYPEYGIKYAEVVEINHKKMLDIIKMCSPEKADKIFEDVYKEYQAMYKRNKP